MAYSKVKIPYKKQNRQKIRRLITSNFLLGIFRGIGMAVGFSGLAVVLIFLIKFIPLDKIPIIGDFIKALIAR